MIRIKADIASFIKRIQPFLDLEIKEDDIVIRPLQSVSQFYQEGKAMHHCVYANEYYKKKDCLILSARVAGKRKETIEVNLKTFKVVQSRAVCNKNSEYHDKIIKLMNKNMNLIRQCV